MFKIGITGNIGSGKTTVSKVFEILGVPVFYADDEAKKVMVADRALAASIKEWLGSNAYFDDGALNRKYISDIVFNNEGELAKLNSLVHPAVFRAFDNWVKQFNNIPYIIKEAALLFESDSYKLCDRSIIVSAPFETRVARVMQRDNISRQEVENRDARQFSEDQKIKLADYIITNDDHELVIPQVLTLHSQFLALQTA